jgi:hypothetical protein
MGEIRPLRRVRPGVARSRDERFELIEAPGCWQVRSRDTEAGALLLSGGTPPECHLRRELAEWLEGIVDRSQAQARVAAEPTRREA